MSTARTAPTPPVFEERLTGLLAPDAYRFALPLLAVGGLGLAFGWSLLGGLALARVEGKSPVEYLTEPSRDRVRDLARQLLSSPPATLNDVASIWHEGLLS